MRDQCSVDTEIHILSKESDIPITLKGNLPALHDSPKKIQQLLDILGLPPGTEARVITKAASVIVR